MCSKSKASFAGRFMAASGSSQRAAYPKPAFNAFKMLHELGEERFDTDSEHALVTRRADGSFVIALWNYVAPGETGRALTIALRLPQGTRAVRLRRLDESHGDARREYAANGITAVSQRANNWRH